MDALRFRLRVCILSFFGILVLGTFGFMIFEKLSAADAFYFTIITVTTVGYGDIHPSTLPGKILAVVLIIIGVGTFLGLVASITEIFLQKREYKTRMQKLNMVIGMFFTELGNKLLALFSQFDPQIDAVRKELVVRGNWSEKEFLNCKALLNKYRYSVDPHLVRLGDLRNLLEAKSSLLLRLWGNPNLLEHEAFTEALRAVFHLKDELLSREDLSALPDSDRAHLAGDINRAYGLMVQQWLDYMHYLKDYYPYLFSHAMRTNPFDKEASPIVKT